MLGVFMWCVDKDNAENRDWHTHLNLNRIPVIDFSFIGPWPPWCIQLLANVTVVTRLGIVTAVLEFTTSVVALAVPLSFVVVWAAHAATEALMVLWIVVGAAVAELSTSAVALARVLAHKVRGLVTPQVCTGGGNTNAWIVVGAAVAEL